VLRGESVSGQPSRAAPAGLKHDAQIREKHPMASIQGIYIALFGRPADPAGLAYFNAETNNGANLTAIGDLAGTDEYQDRFDGLNNVQIVTRIYQELFGRDPDAAGLAYFVAALNSGSQNVNTIAINILDGAQGADAQIVANKVASANLFTASIDTPIEIASYAGAEAAAAGRAYLASVTADATSVRTQAQADAAVAAIVELGVAGNAIEVLDADGAVVGSDVATNTTNDNDTITVTDTYTAAGGVINGGLGFDTLNISVAGGATTTVEATDIVSVERLNVTAGVGGSTINLTAVAGLQQVWSVDSGAPGITIEGVKTSVAVGVQGDANVVNVVYADVAGSSDAATIAINGNVTSALNVAAIETLTLDVRTAATVVLEAADAESIVIKGSGDLTLTAAVLVDDASIDASGLTGKLLFTTGDASDITVVGGALNDVFNISAGAENIVLTGNGGADLFNIGALSNIVGADAAALATSLVDNLISITDFNGAQDTLQIALGGTATEFTNVQEANIAAATSLAAALGVVAVAADAGNYATFVYGGSTYVFQDNGDAAFGAGDGLVKLTGFTGELTDANFVA
jgi:hypothetical protein